MVGILWLMFRRRHMIYAARCCLAGLLYLQDVGVRFVALAIPDIFISNRRMAIACGFTDNGKRQDSIMINGFNIGVTAYIREIPRA
jgi:hypothetical protein